VELNSACSVGSAGMSIDSVNITMMAIRFKMITMELVPLSLKCAFFASFMPCLSIFVKIALTIVAHGIEH
jgi:hypothetical protein